MYTFINISRTETGSLAGLNLGLNCALKSDDQIALLAEATPTERARARNMMYGGLDLWPLIRLIIQFYYYSVSYL